jgi:voltage-gated potassium channel
MHLGPLQYTTLWCVCFTLEYVGRVVANKGHVRTYTLSFFGVIDLLAILPSFFGLSNLTFLKTARVLRILRLLRMVRLAKLAKMPRNKDPDEHTKLDMAAVQIYIAALLSVVLIFGTLIYITEGYRTEFVSIPHGMLWAMKVTIGGVPQYMPATIWGEFITIGARFSGLLLFGLLISIVGKALNKFLLGGK